MNVPLIFISSYPETMDDEPRRFFGPSGDLRVPFETSDTSGLGVNRNCQRHVNLIFHYIHYIKIISVI